MSLLTAARKLDLPGQGLHLYLQQLQVGTLCACVTVVPGEQRKPSRTVVFDLPLFQGSVSHNGHLKLMRV